jgi:hypothetical protein
VIEHSGRVPALPNSGVVEGTDEKMKNVSMIAYTGHSLTSYFANFNQQRTACTSVMQCLLTLGPASTHIF